MAGFRYPRQRKNEKRKFGVKICVYPMRETDYILHTLVSERTIKKKLYLNDFIDSLKLC